MELSLPLWLVREPDRFVALRATLAAVPSRRDEPGRRFRRARADKMREMLNPDRAGPGSSRFR